LAGSINDTKRPGNMKILPRLSGGRWIL